MGQINIKLCRGKGDVPSPIFLGESELPAVRETARLVDAGKKVFFSASISYSGAVSMLHRWQPKVRFSRQYLIVLAALLISGRNLPRSVQIPLLESL